MYRKLFVLTMILGSMVSFDMMAQIENNTNVMRIQAKERPSYLKETNNSNANFLRTAPGLSNPNTSGLQMKSTIGSEALSTEVDRVGTLKNAKLEDYKTDTAPKAFSQVKEGNVNIKKFQRDEYLGDFNTKSEYVQILYRDHQTVDGDLIAIYRNEEVEREKLFLHGQLKKVQLALSPGFNKIDIVALNNGAGAPNTGHFIIYDDKGAIITDSKWGLAPGFKASFIIVKE